ncbi:hypothetical protein, partial [Salmonella sp. s29873]|uniref:hypothetical protein n=1 Tax=unclassified Salmonella TaxID=2614656 RepID=UPI0039816FCD
GKRVSHYFVAWHSLRPKDRQQNTNNNKVSLHLTLSPLDFVEHTQEKKTRLPPPPPHPRKNRHDTVPSISLLTTAPAGSADSNKTESLTSQKYMLNTRGARKENPPRNATSKKSNR